MKRAAVWTAVGLLAVVAMATVSWTPAASIRIFDADAQPIPGAYVQYHYYGHRINPVQPVSYIARGSAIVRADADGRVTIPGRFHVRSPLLLAMPPRLFIDHVYVPRLHNAFGPIAEGTTSRPGVFTLDEARQRVTVSDVSRDPDRWAVSLAYLFDCIRETLSLEGSMAPAARDDTTTVDYARELIGHLQAEYVAFLTTYGQTARARAPAPLWGSERDRQQWEEQSRAQLAREPLWGPYLQRTWRSNLTEIAALDASIR